MVTVNKNNANYFKKLGFAMTIVGSASIVVGILMGGYTDLQLISLGVLMGAGFTSVLNVNKMNERYAMYFNNDSVKSISNLANELEIKEKDVIKNLGIYVKRVDRKSLKNCENVKFISN